MQSIELNVKWKEDMDADTTDDVPRVSHDQLRDEAITFCSCEYNEGSYYVPRGNNKYLHISHWRCNCCAKLVKVSK